MPYHLPVLLNPLVNAVFNCPNPTNSNLKKLFGKLANEDFILLVPSNDKLLNYEDLETGSLLHDLCYTFDFVASHILMIDQSSNNEPKIITNTQQLEFNTLNGKKVILRPQNRMLFTADGFSDKKKHRIIGLELLTNFNDYLRRSERIPLIHIDEPLCGNVVRHENLIITIESEENKVPKVGTQEPACLAMSAFENIIRVHPAWSSEFHSLFDKYRNESINNGASERIFHGIIDDSYSDMKTDNLFLSIPNLHELVYNYVEVNLYDDIWVRLTNRFKTSELNTECLRNLSLDQLDCDLYLEKFEKFRLENVIAMEKNIHAATESFGRLALSHTYSEKSEALIETLQNLSKSPVHRGRNVELPMPIDADFLLSFFVLIVSRTQIKNLKSHLYYLQKFARDESSVKFGLFSYALSTFEAVVCYFEDLKDTRRLEDLKKSCAATQELVNLLLHECKEYPIDFKKYESSLHYRSERGESILSLCIIHGKNDQLIELLRYEKVFPLEDILEDENLDGCSLLVLALLHGNSFAASVIVNILLGSCSSDEMVQYVNRPNFHNRTAAHYLTHETEILQSIGGYVNWTHKDSNGQTPLFTIFRSYDQQNYEEMVKASFQCAVKWYQKNTKSFCFFDHEDNKGNTLLHILKRSASLLLRWDNININAANKKGLTALMVYAKYNRLENVKAILEDKRILIGKTQYPFYLTCFDYAKNPVILNEIAMESAKGSTLGLAFVHTLKYENTRWILHVTIRPEGTDSLDTVKLSLRSLQNLFRTISKIYAMSFVPLEESFERLSILGKMRFSLVGRLETLCLNKALTNCFNALLFIGEMQGKLILDESELTLWIRARNKELNNIPKRQNEKKMEPEEMNVVQNFLRFNQTELSSVKSKLQLLKKLAVFAQLKTNDVTEAHKLFFMYSRHYVGELVGGLFPQFPVFFTYGDGSMTVLAEEIEFLYNCTNKLSDHIQQVLHVSIPKWWKIYADLLELHKEYAQSFPHLLNLDNSSTDESTLGKLLEGKRAKYEKRLSVNITDCKRGLQEIGVTIRSSHESLAEELSKYMEFRGRFLADGIIKKWVTVNIRMLREHLIDMEKIQIQNSTIDDK